MGAHGRRERLDVLLVQRGLASSRTFAQRLIRAGEVLVGTERVDKPGTLVPVDSPLRCTAGEKPYVSRGGQKLAAALDCFGTNPSGLEVVDLGASTGGFVDCLLQRGARRVYAVDVGRGLLDARLAHDPRVVVLDRTNARALTVERIGHPVPLVTADLSFISLLKVLPAAKSLLAPTGSIVALIKPQFEAGKGRVPRGGVVHDVELHLEVLEHMVGGCRSLGLILRDVCLSPLPGAKGNREFFGWIVPAAADVPGVASERLRAVVYESTGGASSAHGASTCNT